MSKRAIIIAAGRGSRLMPYTDEVPKCLVPVGDKTILEYQLAAYRAAGVTEFVIIRGYLGEVLSAREQQLGPGITFVDNADYPSNNILLSLFCAEAALDDSCYISYSDIVFTPGVVDTLSQTPGDIRLVIDRDFAKIYEGRTDHPLSEAEVAALGSQGDVALVGKRAVAPEDAWGEFIGLMQVTRAGAQALCAAYATARDELDHDLERPFVRAPHFRVAYLSDLLQYMIERGTKLTSADISGHWREIDTVQDLERAQAMLTNDQETWR